jgi:hypothetical protein
MESRMFIIVKTKPRGYMPENWKQVAQDGYPDEKRLVWYYFKLTGVNAGYYQKTEYGHSFWGEHGFLTNDVTHWMYLDDYKPSKP